MGVDDRTLFAALAGVLGIVQILPYIRSILRGVTKPSRVANSIWLGSNIVTVASIYATGARAALVLPLAFTLTNLTSTLLSIKHGAKGFSHSDLINAVVAFAALAAWVAMGPRAAVLAMAIAQVTGCVAVVDKLRRQPGTEDRWAWALAGCASIFSVAAIIAEGHVDLAVVAIPVLSGLGFWAVWAMATWQERGMSSRTRLRTPALSFGN